VLGTYRKRRKSLDRLDQVLTFPLEIGPQVELLRWFQWARPDVIFHCVRPESPLHPTQQLFFYVKYVERLLEVLEQAKIPLVYFSDSEVFSGMGGPYSESSDRDGEGTAATLKIQGEQLLEASPWVRRVRLGKLIGLGPSDRPGFWEALWNGKHFRGDGVAFSYCGVDQVGDALDAWMGKSLAPFTLPWLHIGLEGAHRLGEFEAAFHRAFPSRSGRRFPASEEELLSHRYELVSEASRAHLELPLLTLDGWLDRERERLFRGVF
jgi:hypothetical protein